MMWRNFDIKTKVIVLLRIWGFVHCENISLVAVSNWFYVVLVTQSSHFFKLLQGSVPTDASPITSLNYYRAVSLLMQVQSLI